MSDFIINYNTRATDDCCKNCAYCAEVKKWPCYDTVLTKVCLYHVCTANEAYVLEVQDNDCCEVFYRHNNLCEGE
jgi:hypothetical protein